MHNVRHLPTCNLLAFLADRRRVVERDRLGLGRAIVPGAVRALLPLVLLAACAEPRAVAIAPVPSAAPLEIAPIDAGASRADAAPSAPPPSCARTPCLVASNVELYTIARRELFMVREYAARTALVRHGLDDGIDAELVTDLRPALNDSIVALEVDADSVAIATSFDVLLVDRARKASVPLFHDSWAITDVALDPTSLFVLTRDCAVKKVARAGGSPIVLARGTGKSCMGLSLRLDGDDVLFSSEHTISAVPRAGGAVRTLATLQPDSTILDIVPNGAFVYALAMTSRGSVLVRVPRSGGRATDVAPAGMATSTHALAVDEQRAFWLEIRGPGYALMSAPKDGGEPIVVRRGAGSISSLTSAPDGLYFLVHTPRNDLMRLDNP
ncbi:MAG: hypothetical protein KIT84_19170 [Labilithrix sp.]|nr:hypothetical protein [Labilithrix sp.]MCW5813156.1 hypothetical protein [Labilithrix sp.]